MKITRPSKKVIAEIERKREEMKHNDENQLITDDDTENQGDN